MRPGEFFFFSKSKYRQLVTTRDTDQLRYHEALKMGKMTLRRESIPLQLLLAVLSHGSTLIFVVMTFRSIDVAEWKLDIIQAELAKRALTQSGVDGKDGVNAVDVVRITPESNPEATNEIQCDSEVSPPPPYRANSNKS